MDSSSSESEPGEALEAAAGSLIDAYSGEVSADDPAEPALERTVQILEAKLNLHRGPLPSPETLEAYERAEPGSAARMMHPWEKQSDHRMALEKSQVMANIRARTRGQYIGMLVAMTVIIGGFVAIYLDKPLAGIAALVLAAATIAGRFIVTTSRSGEPPQLDEPEGSDRQTD